ncbi:C1 family peptidase [Desulfosediminicola flagellatus]|uniref:C1 family peptidase n=1 Tax=Desulfosediminicola flagellatus TaxID=2569541 RepID=UPI0010AC2298|nr:C1 family peptidase [Desulfosediminicola flagellatus]
MGKKGPKVSRFVLNCGKSPGDENDWNYEDAVIAQTESENIFTGALQISSGDFSSPRPKKKDLRQSWWKIRDQGKTGACVGFATADGVLRWHYVTKGKMAETEEPSPRFIWMANKETDDLTRYPTTFIENAGTSTKLALRIAQKYGCVPEHMLSMNGSLSKLPANVFFSIAAQFRITAYYNLRLNFDHWRSWIAHAGPVLTRLDVDKNWKKATSTNGELDTYDGSKTFGGHAVCLVGYTKDYFIVRNSWGTKWGDKGFAYCSNEYIAKAFTEAYGAVL